MVDRNDNADEGTTRAIKDLIDELVHAGGLMANYTDQDAIRGRLAKAIPHLTAATVERVCEFFAQELAAALSPSEGPGGQQTSRASEPSDAGNGRISASTSDRLRALADRAAWYRDGCDGLEDRDGYYASGDCARDAASDLDEALAEIRVLESVIERLRTKAEV